MQCSTCFDSNWGKQNDPTTCFLHHLYLGQSQLLYEILIIVQYEQREQRMV